MRAPGRAIISALRDTPSMRRWSTLENRLTTVVEGCLVVVMG
jgi:hypothetical protein